MNITTRLLFVCIFELVFNPWTWSQELKIQIDAPQRVQVGDVFYARYKLEDEATSIVLDKTLAGFNISDEPSISTSNSTYIKDGLVNKQKETTFTYSVLAEKEGVFNLPVATIIADSTSYISESFPITVIAKDSSVIDKEKIDSTEIFIRLDIKNTKAYKNQAIVAELKVFTKENITLTSIKNLVLPDLPDFMVYQLDIPKAEFVSDTIEGEIYTYVIFESLLLTPLKSGVYPIGKSKVKIHFRKTKHRNDDSNFFDSHFSPFTSKDSVFQSDSATIHVLDFPSEKPADFNQISGRNLKISTSINKPELRLNESFNLELTISGFGNLKLLQTPDIELPSNMELEKVEYSNELTTDKNGISGQRTFIYSILPKAEGKFEIPSISMSYFNLDREEFERVASPTIIINIKEGGTPLTNTSTTLNYNKLPPTRRDKKPTTMIVLDISDSMLAQDFEPNRKTAAIQELSKYLRKTKHKVGLMLYSAIPLLLHEPTNNNTQLVDTLMTLDEIFLGNGTAIGVGIIMAIDQLKNIDTRNKNLIVLTDGDSNINIISKRLAAEISRARNIRTFIIGLNGKMDNAPFTIKTLFGETVIEIPTTINDEAFTELAQITGGQYYRAFDNTSLYNALRAIDKEIKKNLPENVFDKSLTYSESEIDMIFNVVYQDIKEKMVNSAN